MIFLSDGRVRLTSSELNIIRGANARNGHVVQPSQHADGVARGSPGRPATRPRRPPS